MFVRPHESVASSRRVRRISLLLASLSALAGLPFVLTIVACGGAMGGTQTAPAASSVSGTITIENRSQFAICGLTMIYQGGRVTREAELAPGASASIEITGATNRLFVTECGGRRSLLGHPMNWYGTPQGEPELLQNLEHTRIVLYDPGQAPAQASDHRPIALHPRSIADWIFFTPHPDAQLATTLHAALEATASRQGWREQFVFSLPLADWSPLRNRATGIITGRSVQAAGFARWPDGHCSMQAFGFEQGHDGSGYAGPIRVGASTQLDLPCAVLAYAAGLPGASPSSLEAVRLDGTGAGAGSPAASPAGGSSCTNTCRTAHDGECDDGGPRSLYSVCALGTDCADCGAR